MLKTQQRFRNERHNVFAENILSQEEMKKLRLL